MSSSKNQQADLMKLSDREIMHTYGRQPIVIERGRGSYVWDAAQKKYLDLFMGLSVNNLGHCYAPVIEAVKAQSEKLFHCSNIYYSIPSTLLAQELTRLTFADRVFFCNSGAEANECSLKLARLYGSQKKNPECKEIICMDRSFHGRTFGTLSATGQEKVRAGFDPYLPGFKFVPFGEIDAVRKAITKNTAGILLEVVQAEGGVHVAPQGYLKEIRKICDAEGILLILDEVQTGMGRTGKFCAHEWEGVTPHIMSMSKALGGGLPLGACLAVEEVAAVFEPGKHASTFGGNPVACAAGLAMVKGVSDPKILANCQKQGKTILDRLMGLSQKHKFINDVRGRGLIIGAEFDFEVKDLVQMCLDMGLLVCMAGPKVLRLLPALNISNEELEEGLNMLERAIEESHG